MSKTRKPTHKDPRECVNTQEHFNAFDMFTEEHNGYYVVFSKGRNCPLWMFDRADDTWYGNMDRTNVAISRQAAITRPSGKINYKTTKELIAMLNFPKS